MKKFILSIHDDWELFGNGLGNVATQQYYPSLFFMDISDELGLNPTFMVDVAQPIMFRKYMDKDPNIGLQLTLWEESIKLIKKRGFDIQLHIHPQWLNSKYENGFFYLDNRYNIGKYKIDEQNYFVENGIKYLEELLTPIDLNYKVHSFKAGGWGLQPSESILNVLKKNNIHVVLGLRNKLYNHNLGYDYRGMEETVMGYYPNFENICKKDSDNGIITFPLSYIKLNTYEKLLLFKDNFRERLLTKPLLYVPNNTKIPDEVSKQNKEVYDNMLKLVVNTLSKDYYNHLKIGGASSFSFMKRTFDKKIKSLMKIEGEEIPIIIESHTKTFHNHYDDIYRFLKYISKEYGDLIDFVNLSYIKNKYYPK
jgi:hypothetical protein